MCKKFTVSSRKYFLTLIETGRINTSIYIFIAQMFLKLVGAAIVVNVYAMKINKPKNFKKYIHNTNMTKIYER